MSDVSPLSNHNILESGDSHDSSSSSSSSSSASTNNACEAEAGAAGGGGVNDANNASPVNLNGGQVPRSVTPSADGKSTVKCNCKKSKCLKLYCDCFRISKYCEDCNCVDCNNCLERESERVTAINNILERNPEAFAPRIKHDAETMSKGHLSGCHCKKSACLKKYCECFSAAVACSDKCRCMDCRNSVEHVAVSNRGGTSSSSSSAMAAVSVTPPSGAQAQYDLHNLHNQCLDEEDMLLLAE